MRIAFSISTALAVVSASAAAQVMSRTSDPGIADYISTIGGDTSPKTVQGDRGVVPAVMKPLVRDRGDILGYRFHKQYTGSNGTAFAERARAAFKQECLSKGGHIERDGGPITTAFLDARAVDRSLRPEAMAIVSVGIASICLDKDGHPLGGFLGLARDTSPMLAKGYAGSPFLMQTSGQPSRTAVYAYRASAIPTVARVQQAQQERRDEQHRESARAEQAYAEKERRIDQFRKALGVGTETHCGTVIQLRGPMVELSIPPGRSANGQSFFWLKREQLEPPGVSCSAFW